MKGKILDYTMQTNLGIITGDDGNRYTFTMAEWKETIPPSKGFSVDFEPRDKEAFGIYVTHEKSTKNKIIAGLLALFLGGLGLHKFYLGFTWPGILFLFTNTIGWLAVPVTLAIPNIVLSFIALIEGIIYLTRSDEVFERRYVIEGKRNQWF